MWIALRLRSEVVIMKRHSFQLGQVFVHVVWAESESCRTESLTFLQSGLPSKVVVKSITNFWHIDLQVHGQATYLHTFEPVRLDNGQTR